MNNFNLSNIDMPRFHVGLRTIKTIVVVFLSLCLAYVRQGLANPLYIAIAAILCIQPTMSSSRKAGTDRLIATVIGGFWGIIVFVANNYFFPQFHPVFKYAIISVCLIPLIYTNIHIKRPSNVSTSAVVYLIITVSSSGAMSNVQYLYNRLLDTFMGFLIAIAVNWVKLPSEAEMEAKKAAAEKIASAKKETDKNSDDDKTK